MPVKEIPYILLPLYVGSSSFQDTRHVRNFLKYLASCTEKHPTTNLTRLNYIQYRGEDIGQFDRAGEDGFTQMKAFLDETGYGPEDLKNDLCYWAYAVRFGDTVVSNFIHLDRDTSGKGIMRWRDDALIEDIIQAGAFEDRKAVYAEVGKLCKGHLPVLHINKAPLPIRLGVEALMARMLEMQISEITPLIHVSHVDQDAVHHTHRIYHSADVGQLDQQRKRLKP